MRGTASRWGRGRVQPRQRMGPMHISPAMHGSCSKRRKMVEVKRPGTCSARARAFVDELWHVGCPRVAIENPIGRLSTMWRKPDQIVQPWMFGDPECKATCWWLRGLPLLVPTQMVDGRGQSVHMEPPGPDRWKNRSRTFEGMARACAEQWGNATQIQKQMELNLDTKT